MHKIIDVMNFISNVSTINQDNQEYEAYEWINEHGNIFVDVKEVINKADGTKMLVIQ